MSLYSPRIFGLGAIIPVCFPLDLWGGGRRSPGQLPPPRSQRGYRPSRRTMKRNNKLPRRNGRN